MAYPPEVERWRPIVAQYFRPEDVDKALYVIMYESGGNPVASGDGGSSIGLFQMNMAGGLGTGSSVAALQDPAYNISLAAQAVYGGSGWSPWGEGTLYNGSVFGALGNHPYPGSSDGGTSLMTYPGGSGGGIPIDLNGDGVPDTTIGGSSSGGITYSTRVDYDGSLTGIPGAVVQVGSNGSVSIVSRPSTSAGPSPTIKSGNGVITAIDPSTGAVLWTIPDPTAAGGGSDPDGDGYDNDTGLPVGVVRVDKSVSPTGLVYKGIPVNPDGSPYSGGGTGEPTYDRTQVVKLPDGRTVLLDLSTGKVVADYGSAPGDTGTQQWGSGSSGGGTSSSGMAQVAAAQIAANSRAASDAAQASAQQAALQAQAEEAARQRAFQAAENALNRGMSERQFQATFGLSRAQFLEAQRNNRIQQAKTFSEVVSSTDPLAFRAFLEAGGGNIANALQSDPDGALSDAALLPAARIKQELDRPLIDPGAYGAGAGSGTGTGGGGTATGGGLSTGNGQQGGGNGAGQQPASNENPSIGDTRIVGGREQQYQDTQNGPSWVDLPVDPMAPKPPYDGAPPEVTAAYQQAKALYDQALAAGAIGSSRTPAGARSRGQMTATDRLMEQYLDTKNAYDSLNQKPLTEAQKQAQIVADAEGGVYWNMAADAIRAVGGDPGVNPWANPTMTGPITATGFSYDPPPRPAAPPPPKVDVVPGIPAASPGGSIATAHNPGGMVVPGPGGGLVVKPGTVAPDGGIAPGDAAKEMSGPLLGGGGLYSIIRKAQGGPVGMGHMAMLGDAETRDPFAGGAKPELIFRASGQPLPPDLNVVPHRQVRRMMRGGGGLRSAIMAQGGMGQIPRFALGRRGMSAISAPAPAPAPTPTAPAPVPTTTATTPTTTTVPTAPAPATSVATASHTTVATPAGPVTTTGTIPTTTTVAPPTPVTGTATGGGLSSVDMRGGSSAPAPAPTPAPAPAPAPAPVTTTATPTTTAATPVTTTVPAAPAPTTATGGGLSSVASTVGAAGGVLGSEYGDIGVRPEDIPYLEQILALRQSTQLPDVNPYDVGWDDLDPILRESYVRGMQSKYGIPVASSLFEQAKYALPGMSKAGMGLGY